MEGAANAGWSGGRLGYIYVIFGNQQYRSVAQMLVNSRVTPAALEAALLIVVVSLAITVVYIRRARRVLNWLSIQSGLWRRRRSGGFYDQYVA